MLKIEQNTPISTVEIENINSARKRVLLHRNITEEQRTNDEGGTQTVYVAEEVSMYVTDGDNSLTVDAVTEEFTSYWVQAETGKTPEQFYSDKVNAIVREAYSQSAVEAILNNYIANPNDEDVKAEFEALQQVRAEAKAAAKAALAEITA